MQPIPDLGLMTLMLASIGDAFAREHLALALAATEQAASDGGRWDLAFLLTLGRERPTDGVCAPPSRPWPRSIFWPREEGMQSIRYVPSPSKESRRTSKLRSSSLASLASQGKPPRLRPEFLLFFILSCAEHPA